MARPTLKTEIKQSKPFSSREEEVFLNVLRTAAALQGRITAVLKQHGLTQPQYNVLRILRGAGEQGLPCLEIAGRMVTREPDITRLLDRLEKTGTIARARSTRDRRVVTVTITGSGLDLLHGLDRPVRRLNKEALGHLPAEDLAELNRLLVSARHPPEPE